jgi:hypothetical protein
MMKNQYVCQTSKVVVPPESKINIGKPSRIEKPFSELLYLIDQTKSGGPHPEGVLWFKTGQAKHHERKISIIDIFPTILDLMQVNPCSETLAEVKGQTLMGDWNL